MHSLKYYTSLERNWSWIAGRVHVILQFAANSFNHNFCGTWASLQSKFAAKLETNFAATLQRQAFSTMQTCNNLDGGFSQIFCSKHAAGLLPVHFSTFFFKDWALSTRFQTNAARFQLQAYYFSLSQTKMTCSTNISSANGVQKS